MEFEVHARGRGAWKGIVVENQENRGNKNNDENEKPRIGAESEEKRGSQ